MDDPNAIVSPGGVGFDINCGVRLLRTNLTEKDVQPFKVCYNYFVYFFLPKWAYWCINILIGTIDSKHV
jgi:hypothetical protein